jgi:hypothetical protein
LSDDTAVGDRGPPALTLAFDQSCHILATALGGDKGARVKDQHYATPEWPSLTT